MGEKGKGGRKGGGGGGRISEFGGGKSMTTDTTIRKFIRFFSDPFARKVVYDGPIPRVLIDPKVYKQMCAYVSLAASVPFEISWLGLVRKVGSDFMIYAVHLLKQEGTAATTVITTDGLAQMGKFIHESLPDEERTEAFNSIRFWGHVHPGDSTSPSGQDERQMQIFAGKNAPYFIRAIFGQSGRVEFNIYLYDRGVVIEDAEWIIQIDDEDAEIIRQARQDFGERVREKTFATYTPQPATTYVPPATGYVPPYTARPTAPASQQPPVRPLGQPGITGPLSADEQLRINRGQGQASPDDNLTIPPAPAVASEQVLFEIVLLPGAKLPTPTPQADQAEEKAEVAPEAPTETPVEAPVETVESVEPAEAEDKNPEVEKGGE